MMAIDHAPLAETGSGAPLVESPLVRADPTRSRAARLIAVIVPPAILVACLVAVWYFVSYVGMSEHRRFLVPPPHEVIDQGFLQWDNLHKLLDALWSTVRVAGIGLTLSIIFGVGIALAMSQAKLIERAVFPLMVAIQATPILAVTPLIALVFGTNQTSRVVVCVVITIFPIVLNTLYGLISADGGLHDMVTLHHGGRMMRMRKVMFPSALPSMFAGLRIAAGLAVIGAIVGDFFFGRGEIGLGQLMKQFANNSNYIPLLYATVIIASALGIAVFLTFGALQGLVIGKWYDSRSGSGR